MTARVLPFVGHVVLAGSLAACSSAGLSGDAPLGATVTNSSIETKYQRDDVAGKKLAMDTSRFEFRRRGP